MQAQLNIVEYFVDSIAIQTNDNFQHREMVSGKINVDFDIKRNPENTLEFMIALMVELNTDDNDFESSEYRIMLNVTGYFAFTEGTDENTIKNMIAPSGLSILYGVARGVVAQITGNSRHGKFILPTLNFIEIIRNKFKKEDPEVVAASANSSPRLRKKNTTAK